MHKIHKPKIHLQFPCLHPPRHVGVSDNPPDVSSPDHQAAGDQGSVKVSLLRTGSEGELALLQPQHH